jgi:DNA polymerase-3 subunit epsilon
MGRCLSPCLGDLDPNLYRERLDGALALFTGGEDGGAALLAHVEGQMRAASAAQRYERAAWLHRRLNRLEALLARLGGVLRAAHAGARLVLAPHPSRDGVFDAFWIVGGRVADWGPCPEDPEEVAGRTAVALRRAVPAGLGGWLPADELDEARIVGAWLAGHEAPALELDPPPAPERLRAFVAGGTTARLSSAA